MCSECGAGVQVLLYAVEGGGHMWPGGSQYVLKFVFGRVSRDMNSNEAIWESFEVSAPVEE